MFVCLFVAHSVWYGCTVKGRVSDTRQTSSTKHHLWSDSRGGEWALIVFDGWSHRWGTFTPVKSHLGKELKKKKKGGGLETSVWHPPPEVTQPIDSADRRSIASHRAKQICLVFALTDSFESSNLSSQINASFVLLRAPFCMKIFIRCKKGRN